MADPDPFDLDIPEFIRLTLEHHRIPVGARKWKPKTAIEPTFIPEMFSPPADALTEIGRVAVQWSVLEHVIQMLLSRLALTSQYPTFALTADLKMDNSIRAVKSLVALHKERYQCQLADVEILDVIADMMPVIAALKGKRNVIVHSLWLKGIEPGTLQPLRARPRTMSTALAHPDKPMPITEITETANEIRKVANGLFALAQLLPEADESWLIESLSQEKRHPHPDVKSEHQPLQIPPEE